MHRLLRRQLRKHLGIMDEIPAPMRKFVDAVDAAYVDFDSEQELLDRSFSLATKELSEATNALRESEAVFRAVMDHMTAVVFLRDMEGRFKLVNRKYEEIYHVSLESVRGKTLHDVYPTELADLYSVDDREIIVGQKTMTGEMVVEDAGETRTFSKSMFPVFNHDGQMIAYGGVKFDITERKEAEERLADAFDVISSSINYASRIQRAILPTDEMFSSAFSDNFVIWEPRDVVGGDVYWLNSWGDGDLVILGDCTGHGVPGAFMTLIATSALNAAKKVVPAGDVSELISQMHQGIQTMLGQDGSQGNSDDGLDLGACYINPDRTQLSYSGARFSLFIAEAEEVQQIKGGKVGIGYRGISKTEFFPTELIKLRAGVNYYMTSDGLLDQIGGNTRRHRGFGKRRFIELVRTIQDRPFDEQRTQILETLRNYQGNEPRRDDVAVLGFKII